MATTFIRPDAAFPSVRIRRSDAGGCHKPKISLVPLPFGSFLLFVLGILLQVNIEVVGQLSVGEVIFASGAVFAGWAAFKRPGFFSGSFLMLWGMFFLSLCAYITSDLAQGTEVHDALRGWARLVFLLVDFLVFYMLSRKSRFVFFPLWMGVLAGQAAIYLRPVSSMTVLWKFHLSLQLAVAAVCAIGLWGRRGIQLWCALIFTVTGVASFLLDSQSSGGICLASAALLVARALAARKLKKLMPVVLALAIVLSAAGALVLRDRTQSRYGKRQQMSLAMRMAAILTGVETIARHPWLGTGSWQTDFESSNRHRENTLLAGAGYDPDSGNQAGHSQILQSWVEAGIFAAIPFIYYLWRMLASLQWALVRPLDRYSAFAFFTLVNGIWSCLFSPFLGDHRILIGMTACVCVILAEEKKTVMAARARATA